MKLIQRLGIGYIRTKFKVLSFFSKRMAAQKAFILFSTPRIRSISKAQPGNAERIQFTMTSGRSGNNTITVKGFRWNHPQPEKVLILHGFESAAHKFTHYISPLLNKGYEVLAFDAPAHGESEGKSINAIEYSEMIKKVMELYGPIRGFIAHSFGGLALCLALESIEQDEQTRIVLIAPATETSTAVSQALFQLKLHDPVIRAEFERIIYTISGKSVSWYSVRRALKNIKASVLWIHDEEDQTTPIKDVLPAKADQLEQVEFYFTRGLGHRKIYHDQLVKNKIMDFL